MTSRSEHSPCGHGLVCWLTVLLVGGSLSLAQEPLTLGRAVTETGKPLVRPVRLEQV